MTAPTRQYPEISEDLPAPTTPISFVCVRFSGDYDHNIMTSACVHDPMNQFITVDNRRNLFFPTLSAAIIHGIEQAEHDLIAVVHEDVVLIDAWQARLEASLSELERDGKPWGLVGSVGWVRKNGKSAIVGHYSDPNRPIPPNTFGTVNYTEVQKLDEQILILRKSVLPLFDPHMPSIHNIGEDLVHALDLRGLKTYAVNAPTIHKYADAHGKPIQARAQSPKIVDRTSLTYLADKAVSDDYLARKWQMPQDPQGPAPDTLSPAQQAALDAPIILLGRGGGGTRLISVVAQDCGVFLGTKVNPSGDTMDMVSAIYQAVFRRYLSRHAPTQDLAVENLRRAAATMLDAADWPDTWGFKLPEAALILPQLHAAFPKARYVYFPRDPAETVLRRSHMTARLDNHIGRTALPAAYDFYGLERAKILEHGQFMRMAVTTCHQRACMEQHLHALPQDRYTTLSFAQTLSDPAQALQQFAAFTGTSIQTRHIVDTVDADRASTPPETHTSDDAAAALAFLKRHAQVSPMPKEQSR